MLRWLTNINNPDNLDNSILTPRQKQEIREYVVGKIIGEPKVAEVKDASTLEELKRYNMVGVYIDE